MRTVQEILSRVQTSVDAITAAVQTSWLNVAFCSVFTHSGFLTSNPLIDAFTHVRYTSPQRAADNYGTFYMALLAQAASVGQNDLVRIHFCKLDSGSAN